MISGAGSVWAVEKPIEDSVEAKVFKPMKLDATPERLSGLSVPDDFEIEVFAEGLEAPRMMAEAENGDIYVTRRQPIGDVLLLRDADGDGEVNPPVTVAKIPAVHGIAIRDGKVYLAAVREVFVADIQPDGTLSEPKMIYDDLPDAGQHPNRTMAFSPKGELFLSVGSTCNAAPEVNEESATMLRVKTDGSGREIFASGLRNTIGFDWEPATGELWGLDHGIDWLGDDTQKEELNLLMEGKRYGWPFVYERGTPNVTDNPKDAVGETWEEYAAGSVGMKLGYTAHAAPMALVFYDGAAFPEEYRGDAFATMHGSWNRGTPSGYEVVRIKFKDGEAIEIEPWITGFFVAAEKGQFARPCGLIVRNDGSLLMSDDSGGAIYRISHRGEMTGTGGETAQN